MATKLSNLCRVHLHQYDLTIGGVECGLGAIKEAQDKTTVNDTAEKREPGAVGDAEVSFSGLYNTEATGDYLGLKALAGVDTEQPFSVHIGQAVADVAGLVTVKVKAIKTGVRFKELLPLSGDFAPMRFPEWGHVLYPKTTRTASVNGGSVDGGAQTTAGGAWAYHIFAWSATGGAAKWTLALEDSADNTIWAAVAGEPTAIDITGVGSARREFTGTLRRYVRMVLTLDATSGSITLALTLIRN